MNKKYYLLAMVLLGGMVAYLQVDAKSISSHIVSKGVNTSQQQAQTSSKGNADAQDEAAFRPQVGQILFSGNTKISSEKLKDAIPLKIQDVANENQIMSSMVKIAQLYKAKNIKVTITPLIEQVSSTVTNIHFDIHEMPVDKN